MSNRTNYGDISPRTAGKAMKRLLKRGQHLMVVERFGQKDSMRKNQTKTVKWRRYNSLARASAPLAEGITPKGKRLTYTDVNATLEQYGDLIELTDVIKDTHEDPIFKESMDLCGEQAAETVEELRIAVIKAGSNVHYADAATTRETVNSPPTRGNFRKIYRQFKKNKAREISKIIRATDKIATQPVEPAYFCMGHTDLKADLKDITGFIPVANYSNSMKALPGEVGSIEEFRIILTAMFEPWEEAGASGTALLSGGIEVTVAAECDVYPLIFVARDAYGIIPLQGFEAVVPYVINPDKPTKSDPLAQLGYVAWKTYQTAAILNHSWLARLECGATANPD
jgi:N4-gp56 family major capsid protein